MKILRSIAFLLSSVAVVLSAGAKDFGEGGSNAPISLTLQNSFIAEFKDRATMDGVQLLVDQAHERANPASKDGDLHVAGRSDRVGLPVGGEFLIKWRPGS